jgi:iron(III) transport system substrate-binding protein
LIASPAFAADLPAATKKMLSELKQFDAALLSDIDEELKVPPAWIAGAKTEGKLRYNGTFGLGEWPKFIAPFKARYPFVEIDHQRSSRMGRVDKPLIAFREGRVVTDIIAAIGGRIRGFQAAGALTDLRELPNFKRIHPMMRAKDGSWAGERVKYWCMAYNTKLLKQADLPKNWDDITRIKALHKGNIGLSNRPHNWILPFWTAKGPEWTTKMMQGMFRTAKPQLRKEGARAIVTLAIAGEFHAAIPATDYRVNGYAKKGAPIAWHCPEPVPMTISEIVIIKGTKKPNSAKLFINWFLSKEGQIAQYYAAGGAPVHKELQGKGFTPYPAQVTGKQIAVRSADSLIEVHPKVLKVWNALWSKGGGPMAPGSGAQKVVNTKLTGVKRGGRQLVFKAGGAEHKVKLSRSRTKVLIGGQPSERGKLKRGMACAITYPGNGEEAKQVSCK